MFSVFLNFSKRFTITPTAFSLKCIPDTARKPYLNLATWHGRSWEFSRLSSPVSFVSQFFPQFVSLLSPFTINRKKKTGGSFNTLVRNVTRERKHSKQGYGCHWDVTSFLSQCKNFWRLSLPLPGTERETTWQRRFPLQMSLTRRWLLLFSELLLHLQFLKNNQLKIILMPCFRVSYSAPPHKQPKI